MPVTASAAVESWCGTVDELCEPIRALIGSNVSPSEMSLMVGITWSDGSHQQESTLDHLKRALQARSLDDPLTIRIETQSGPGGVSGTLVARHRFPGVSIGVTGDDEAKVLGAAELAFQRLMIGYVDRMGSWRGLAWSLTALAPLLLVIISLAGREVPASIRLAILAIALSGSFASFKFSYPSLLVSAPMVLLDHVPDRQIERWKGALVQFYEPLN